MTAVTHQHASPGRIPELFLTLISAGVSIGAYLLVFLGVDGAIPSNWAVVAGGLGGIAFLAHILIRAVATYADPVLLPTVLALNGLGLAMIQRIDLAQDSSQVAGQAIYSVIGIALAVATLIVVRDHRMLRKFTYTALLVAAVLLILPLLPGLGREVYGARTWISLFGFSFQPAELAKILLAIFFAGYLVVNRDNLALAGPKFLGLQLPRAKHLAPIMLAWAVCLAVLILQKDLGTSILFFGLFVSMLYIATDRLSWMIIGGLLALGGGFVAFHLFPHVQARFTVWLNAMDQNIYEAPYGSYQVVQGQFGMASGGLFGTGLGEGFPTIVPQANSDFIIASIGEELGMAGVFAVLALYAILAIRGLRSAAYVRDGFGKLLAAGLSFTIALQVFVVVGGVTRLIPLTGLTLPFLALGGSSLLCNWIIVGLLLRISDGARRPQVRSSEPLPAAWEEFEDETHDEHEDALDDHDNGPFTDEADDVSDDDGQSDRYSTEVIR